MTRVATRRNFCLRAMLPACRRMSRGHRRSPNVRRIRQIRRHGIRRNYRPRESRRTRRLRSRRETRPHRHRGNHLRRHHHEIRRLLRHAHRRRAGPRRVSEAKRARRKQSQREERTARWISACQYSFHPMAVWLPGRANRLYPNLTLFGCIAIVKVARSGRFYKPSRPV